MKGLRKLLHNFWFCLSMAVFSLIALSGAILDGGAFWIAIDVFCVVWWVFAAYKTTRSVGTDDIPLTDEQMLRIKIITRRFTKEMEDIVNEAKDNESNNGEDKKADKKESSDE